MKALLTIVFLATSIVGLAQGEKIADGKQVVIRNVNVVPMDSERILRDQTVVISDGRITALGQAGDVRYDARALVIDGGGKYLIPGLAEMHAHVPPSEDLSAMKDVLMLFALNGITTIRGMLGHPKHLELREALKRKEVFGPHFYTTGPSFNGMSVKSPEEGAAMVRRQKEAGYDYLKLHPGLRRAEFDAIAATAKKVGIPFAGHVSFGVGVWRAIEAGYSSIDHLDGFVEGLVPDISTMNEQQAGLFGMYLTDKVDRSRIPELMEALREQAIWVVPTQALAERWFHPDFAAEQFREDPHSVYMKPETVEQWISSKKNLTNDPRYEADEIRKFVELRRELILACYQNGVGLLLGCDAPQVFNVPGFSTHQELEYLVLSGLTPFQALETGTRNVGRYLGKSDVGIIRTGAVSDLILLDGNPLEDIRNTTRISGVMLGDRWLDRSVIEAELKKLVRR